MNNIVETSYPLSSGQAAMWFIYQMAPESVAYNIFITAKINAYLDILAVNSVWDRIVERHPVLRTTYTTIAGEAIQQINQHQKFQVEFIDAANWSEDYLKSQIFAETDRPFNLERDAVLRINLFTRSATEHILLLTMHHIAGDLGTFELLLSEFQAAYPAEMGKARLGQIAAADDRLDTQYLDFVRWQLDLIASEQGEKLWQYWQKQLAGELPILNLLTDKPRPPVQTYRGTTFLGNLDERLVTKLDRLAIASGTSLYKLLLTAYNVLIYRYTDQKDIPIATPMRGRSRKEFHQMVGYFVNRVVLRTEIPERVTFLELLAQVGRTVTAAQRHQHYPFALLAQKLAQQHNPSRAPLCQVGFTWQAQRWCAPSDNSLSSPEHLLEMSPYLIGHQRGADLDVNLMVMEAQGVFQLCWQYNTDLFEIGTIERMAGHFVTLLEGIVDNPSQRISQLPILTAVEQQQLLVEWNDTQVDYPQDICIHQLFEAQVARTPDAVAVVFENQQLTYRELNVRANQLAHHLQSLGVETDVLVGICVERSLEMLVGLLGILKAGGAYVPLDSAYPQDRLQFMLADTQVAVLLTQQQLVTSLPQHQARVVCLDTDWQVICQLSHDNVTTDVQAANLAYVIYTSGSTGQPKGVMLSHQNLCNHMFWMQATFPLTEHDKVLQKTPFGFDASVWEFYAPLLVGGQLLIAQPGGHTDSAYLLSLIAQQQVTTVQLVPSLLQMLLEQGGIETCHSLKQVFCGGEVLPVALQAGLLSKLNVNLVNLYGPTEACIDATFWNCQREMSGQVVPIGRPIANTQIYILDQYLQPVPVGIPGELHIGGDGLARGYLNRPELTTAKFIPNPFNPDPNSRLYKTGDLARYLSDGNIEYLGRIDNQVKIRGFRIELGEIETVLSQHPQIQSAVVIARQDTPGNQRLVAYIVPQPQQTPITSQLRQFLKTQLPDHMVPNAFVILDSLPLTPNGKIDRRALLTPDTNRDLLSKFVAPRTPVEEILALIWAQVLKVAHVGIEDNFFERGGHSLLATQLISRIRSDFQVELPLRSLFAAPTVAELAQTIHQLQQQDLALTAPPIVATPRTETLSLSFAQTRLWFIDQLETNSVFYNIPVAMRLVGDLNQAALAQSLSEIINRHEILRTNFITIDGEPVQIIHPEMAWQLEIIDWQHLSSTEAEMSCQELMSSQRQQPFDLATATLIRATLGLLSQTEQILLICMHHIISDGWSMGVLREELALLYNAYSQGQPSPLELMPVQYADFAVWQRQWLHGEVLDSQLNYWQHQLADAPQFLPLPTDRPRPAVQRFRGAHSTFALSPELSQGLTQLSQQQGVTLFMTLLAAFDTLLYRYTGQADILVGSPIANRNRQELEGLIGFFINTLVLRTDLSGNPSFNELLVRVREMALGAYAHQDLPFEMLVEVLQPQRDLSHTPLFQVMFVLQNAPVSPMELTGLTVSPVVVQSATAKFDLTLAIENTPDGLVGVWEYNTDLFDPGTIDRMMGHLVTLLEGIVANPSQRIAQLPLLTAVEQQQLLVEWNRTQVDDFDRQCIDQLFEEQVSSTPEAVAVVFDNQQLTYGELNHQANQLAHYLRSVGVKPDVLVGICVERSLEMVVGLLGILKAGGAYVPLDPEYPTERLRFILADAQVSVLLSQQHLLEKLPQHQARVVCLDTDWAEIAHNSDSNPLNVTTASNLAYVIYTSGSTGQPKGVLVNHANVVRLFAATEDWYHFDEQDVWTLFHSYAFDFSVWEIWGALLSGGRLVVVSYLVTRSPESFYQLLCQEKVTILNQTPSAFRQLIAAEQSSAIAAQLHLRLVIFGGEALELTSLQPWFDRHGDESPQLVNMYGITETTVHVTYRPLSQGDLDGTANVIGRPIPDLQVYVLDQYLQPVPIGVPGEMYIGGAGVTCGYLNRPELTAGRFIVSPFHSGKPLPTPCPSEEGSRKEGLLYKSGDLARYLPNGELEYLGRIDEQVKIRGFRIELGEIEALLAQHPAVRESVVVVREDEAGDKRLVAYVVPQVEQSPTTAELRRWLKEKLPEYMVPNAIVVLESLPLTPSGKIDRRGLPAPDLDPELVEKYVPPRNPIEERLALIWAQVLKVEQVGIHDTFFELGGHSLLATQLVSTVRSHFQVELPLRSLFTAATVAELAASIQQLQAQNLRSTVPPMLPRRRNNAK
jgi:amino acid adenylation domain-containing protein